MLVPLVSRNLWQECLAPGPSVVPRGLGKLYPVSVSVTGCINARRARATAFPGREGGLSEPRARLVNVTGIRDLGCIRSVVLYFLK